MLRKLQLNSSRVFLFAFLIIAGASVFFAIDNALALKEFFRLVLLAGGAVFLSILFKKGYLNLEKVFFILALLAILESAIGIAQFFKQSSLGLGFIGESVLNQEIGGVAKIIVDGAKLIRAYGTFPHPNILAAFLILGLVSLYYLFIKTPSHSERSEESSKIFRLRLRMTIIGLGIFVVSLGLLFAFSRTAWLLAILATIALIGYSKNWRLAIIVSSITLIIFIVFNPYILSRAKVSRSEPSVSYRLTYNKIAWEIIKKNPLGVGIGNQVLYSSESGLYEKFGLTEDWQKQPIHNIYLLIASEIGILGLLIFLAFLVKTIFYSKNVIVIVMLSSLLLFGLVDHFLWTLNPGRLMLWLVIGILMEVNGVHRSMDRAQPSEG